MTDQPPTYPNQPEPSTPHGQPQNQPQNQPQTPYGFEPPQQGWTPPPAPPRDPDKRPGTVTAASIITIVSSLVALVGTGLGLVALLVARDDVMDEMRDQPGFDTAGLDADALYDVFVVSLIVFVVWCLVGVILGFWALSRSNLARAVLTVSAALTALVSLVAIMSLVSAIPLLAAVAVLVLLYVGGSNEWYGRRR